LAATTKPAPIREPSNLGYRAASIAGVKMSRFALKVAAAFRPLFEQLVMAFMERYRRAGAGT
jgi:hypothetical protein